MEKQEFLERLRPDLQVLKEKTLVASKEYEERIYAFHVERRDTLKKEVEKLHTELWEVYKNELDRLVRRNTYSREPQSDFVEYITKRKQLDDYQWIGGKFSNVFELKKNIEYAKKSIEVKFAFLEDKILAQMVKVDFPFLNVVYTSNLVGSSDCEILIREGNLQVHCRYITAEGAVQKFHYRFIITGKKN